MNCLTSYRRLVTLFLSAIPVVAALLWLGAMDLGAATVPGTGSVTGTVTASKAFKAAQVYIRSTDKRILYMVYTAGGRYRAINLLPGKYEINVKKEGFSAETKQVVIAAGSRETADFSLREGQPAAGRRQGSSFGAIVEAQLVAYDQLYPAGQGKQLVEKTCVVCHGPNFLPSRQWDDKQAKAALNLMMNPAAEQGAQIPAGTLSQNDQETILAYIVKNFGPDSVRRALKVDAEFPLDEQVLSKAMYVEYYLPPDPSATRFGGRPGRMAQDPHFDNQGNVWYTDRGVPNRVGMVDPRTGSFKEYVLPDPKADPHGLTVDKEGTVWWSETRGLHLGKLDPKTGKMVRYPMDPEGRIKGGQGHTPLVDSKQNLWFTVIIGNKIGKWDRKTEKITLYEPPTANSYPYGIVLDKNDKVWMAEFHGCKIAHYDPNENEWREIAALTQPCLIRRLGLDEERGTVWYGVYSSGKLGKIDINTGKVKEYKIPMPYSQPYDTWPDRHGNIWIGDDGQGGAILKFDPKTEKFTYYPSPQIGDMPKFEITREGAIWYCPRSAAEAAVGVLYPDVDNMTALDARY